MPAALRVVAAAALVASLAYFVADVVTEGLQPPDVLYYSSLLFIVAATVAVVELGKPRRPELWILGFDIVLSLVLAGRMLVPTTTVSGTVLVVSLKMLAIAFVVPWGMRLQAISVLVGAVGYLAILSVRTQLYGPPALVHQLLGPPLAAFLSLFGFSVLDRARRELFERNDRLLDSDARLRTLLAEREADTQVAEALARVSRVVVGAINKPGLLDRLAEEAAAVLEADFGHVLLFDRSDDAYHVAAGWGDPPEVWQSIRMMSFSRADLPDAHMALDETGLFQSGPDDPDPLLPPDVQRPYGITRAMVAQLRYEGAPLGLIAVGFRERRQAFSPHQERIARGIARVASLGLANARLFDELEKANRVKADFVATMSHELRTPLNVILGYHELLLEEEFGPLTREQRDTLGRLQINSRQLLDMIDATLDLSRLDAGRVEAELVAIDVQTFLDGLRRDAAEVASRAARRVEWTIPPGLPTLTTDPVKLRVVLKNLLANALKFADGGAVRVTARAGDGGIEFSVADDGIGIAPEAQARIFEPFRQADESIGPRFGGAGLGLHISRRLVDLLGGTIAVESRLGHGATFRVWLPVRPPAADAKPSALH